MTKHEKRDRSWLRIGLALAVFGLVFALMACTTPITSASKYEQMVGPIVTVETVSEKGHGSGIVIEVGEQSLVITNAHVAFGNGPVVVKKNGVTYEAKNVRWDSDIDLAILVVEGNLGQAVHYHPIEPLQVFDEVMLVGAGGVERTPFPTWGIVSNVDSKGGIQIHAGVMHGMSGGAAYRFHNGHYELVGVIHAMGLQGIKTPMGIVGTPNNTLAYVIPFEALMEFINAGDE